MGALVTPEPIPTAPTPTPTPNQVLLMLVTSPSSDMMEIVQVGRTGSGWG